MAGNTVATGHGRELGITPLEEKQENEKVSIRVIDTSSHGRERHGASGMDLAAM